MCELPSLGSAAGQPLRSAMNRSYLNPLMFRFVSFTSGLPDRSKIQSAPTLAPLLPLAILLVFVLCSAAAGQDFTLQMSEFDPSGVDPGGNSSSTLTLGVSGGFSGSVDLTCQVTPAPPDGNAGCQISPTTVTPPTGSSVTITTANWSAGGYTIAITGTASGVNAQTVSRRLSVLSVTPSFTVTVGTVIKPSSVPAGSSGVGTIDVNPIYGYAGTVTLACTSVSPVVVSPPVCTFNPPTLTMSGAISQSSTLTINTTGPTTITQAGHGSPRLYAFWLPFPIALVGLGAAARGRKFRGWTVFVLLCAAGALLLTPACGSSNTSTTTTPSNLITPNNTYTFTITAIDNLTGASASNTSGGSLPSVTLTVTTATTN